MFYHKHRPQNKSSAKIQVEETGNEKINTFENDSWIYTCAAHPYLVDFIQILFLGLPKLAVALSTYNNTQLVRKSMK